MSVTGLCQICERREAEYVCHRCGAAVCTLHFDKEHGVCVNCASAEGTEDVADDAGDVPRFR